MQQPSQSGEARGSQRLCTQQFSTSALETCSSPPERREIRISKRVWTPASSAPNRFRTCEVRLASSQRRGNDKRLRVDHVREIHPRGLDVAAQIDLSARAAPRGAHAEPADVCRRGWGSSLQIKMEPGLSACCGSAASSQSCRRQAGCSQIRRFAASNCITCPGPGARPGLAAASARGSSARSTAASGVASPAPSPPATAAAHSDQSITICVVSSGAWPVPIPPDPGSEQSLK